MSEFNHVTDVNCKKGLMSSRVEIIMKRDTALPSELVQQIALAVDHLVSGRQLVLSGEAIQMHTTVNIASHMHGEPDWVGVIRHKLAMAEARVAELTKEVADARKDARELQEIVDGAAHGIFRLQWASTRNKEARERFAKRNRHG